VGKSPYIFIFSESSETISTLSGRLASEGFTIDTASEADGALSKIKHGIYDLILLNSVSLGMKGLDICRAIKSDPQTNTIPLIVIAVTRHEVDAVLSLEIGADDYMSEPVNTKELAARIKAVLRRTHTKLSDTKFLQIGEIIIDKDKCTVHKRGKKITLTAQSFKLLCFLAERPGHVFTRQQLLQSVWNHANFVGLRTVDVHIRKLREKLEDDPERLEYIKTFRGIGYLFEYE
jgi:two-component system phosphate regulon response regulator PhoB